MKLRELMQIYSYKKTFQIINNKYALDILGNYEKIKDLYILNAEILKIEIVYHSQVNEHILKVTIL